MSRAGQIVKEQAMLQTILFPTDGSPLSDRAIPMTAAIAYAQGAEVIVARVVEPLAWIGYEPTGYVSPQVYQDMVDGVEQAASDDLRRIAARLHKASVRVRTAMLRGSAGVTLLDYEREVHPDLVVMATHGRTGLIRFALGSVADLLVREGTAPVLLVRPFTPSESIPTEPTYETALVPLDGSALAEEALSMVEALAGKPLQRVVLLRAIAEVEERTAAVAYLDQVAQRLAGAKLQTKIRVELDQPAGAIARAAEAVDLVILSTHGRGGLDRIRHGSVADQATRHLLTPTLLVRAGSTAAASAATAVKVATV
jgi:nucleotide-binding universal stress UspA family protein